MAQITTYFTLLDGTINSSIRTDIGQAEPYPGTSDFNLDMIPIRAGMFNSDGYIDIRLSGNSDVDLYYANTANVLNGYKCKVKVKVDGSDIATRKGESTIAEDTDLNLVLSKRIKGGSTIRFLIDSMLTSINSGTEQDITAINVLDYLNNNNLIAAISPRVLMSETNPLTLDLLSVWSLYSGGAIDSTMFTYRTSGGRSGDYYNLLATYIDPDGVMQTVIWKDNGTPGITIDNTAFYLNPTAEDSMESKIPAGSTVTLYLTGESGDTIASNSFVVGPYIV